MQPNPSIETRDPRAVRLDSWKEIAAYLKRGERTVRRWEQLEGLPVHRHLHDKAASVYAFADELDEWTRSRAAAPRPEPAKPNRIGILIWVGALTGLLASVALAIALRRSPPPVDVELTALPLTSYPGDETDAGPSPDGSEVAFSWSGTAQDNWDIYIKSATQDSPRRLTSDAAEDFNPVWSPDGRTIAFLREVGDAQTAVLTIPAAGGTESTLATFFRYRAVERKKFQRRYLTWHPSGKYLIASMSHSPVEPYALYAVSLDGKRQTLTKPSLSNGIGFGALGDVNPTCSPDGKSVAFTRNPRIHLDGELYVLGLSVAIAPEGEPRFVWWAGTGVSSPLWTHNGRELVYQRRMHSGLWRVNALEQGPPRRLRLETSGADNPAISADGRVLLFSAGQRSRDVVRIHLTDGKIQPVIASSHMEIGSELSPDGKRIVFGSTRSGVREIWVADADGSRAMQLSRLNDDLTGSPSWSPDGKWIAFDSRAGGKARLYLTSDTASTAGQPVRQLLAGPSDDAVPRWSRDGKWLYFCSTRSGPWEAWKVSTSDFTNPQQITTAGGIGPVESPDGKYLYYGKTASGALEIWRMKTAGGPEEQLLREFSIGYQNFLPVNDGVYFVPNLKEEKLGLMFLDFPTGKTRRLAEMPKSFVCCLDLSKDRRYMYTTAEDDSGRDLMIVRNFR